MNAPFLPGPVRRVLLVATAVLLAMSMAAGLALARPSSPAARAAAQRDAQHLWAMRAFSHYRLVVHAPSWCKIDAEVQQERVVKVFQNSCPVNALTVSGLFEYVDHMNQHPDRQYCGPNGCECVEQRFAQTEYDATLGYPRAIRVRRQRSANWEGLWGYMLQHGLPSCLTPPDTDMVTVVSLQPLS